jgi:GntR family transcriptional repressor for pyruvate dehydrogenase complex
LEIGQIAKSPNHQISKSPNRQISQSPHFEISKFTIQHRSIITAMARSASREKVAGPVAEGSTEQVVSHVRALIERGALKPGDRLPAERDLALHVGVSRPTVRAGLRALAAIGVVQARHGSGTFIPSGPPTLGSEPLSFLAALHGITHGEMYEARRILESEAAALAAERATNDQIAALDEEVTNMFDALHEPQIFLVHDINFHRIVASASGNPIVASLVDMVSRLFYEKRKETAERATDRNLRDAADMHRRIYRAIREHDGDGARTAMNEHLLRSSAYTAQERDTGARAATPKRRGRR